jgi:hypothetical protein
MAARVLLIVDSQTGSGDWTPVTEIFLDLPISEKMTLRPGLCMHLRGFRWKLLEEGTPAPVRKSDPHIWALDPAAILE